MESMGRAMRELLQGHWGPCAVCVASSKQRPEFGLCTLECQECPPDASTPSLT